MKTVIEESPNAARHGARASLLLLTVTLAAFQGIAVGQAPKLPDARGQAILIKNSVAAVNHGTITGNFTVLRDLGSEKFRKNNTAVSLGTTFANLRKQKLDLSPILITDPKLTQKPSTDGAGGRMQLVGYFPTRPQAVKFTLTFQHVAAGWMIDDISLAVVPTESIESPQRAPQANSQARPPTNPNPHAARRPNYYGQQRRPYR